jgi:hypothetical protein
MNTKEKNQKNDVTEEGTKKTGGDVLRWLLTGVAFLAMLAFWATFVYAVVVKDVKLVTITTQIIGIMVGVAVPVMIIQKLLEKIKGS